MTEKYVYIDFESCMTIEELRGFVQRRIQELKEIDLDGEQIIRIIFDNSRFRNSCISQRVFERIKAESINIIKNENSLKGFN